MTRWRVKPFGHKFTGGGRQMLLQGIRALRRSGFSSGKTISGFSTCPNRVLIAPPLFLRSRRQLKRIHQPSFSFLSSPTHLSAIHFSLAISVWRFNMIMPPTWAKRQTLGCVNSYQRSESGLTQTLHREISSLPLGASFSATFPAALFFPWHLRHATTVHCSFGTHR